MLFWGPFGCVLHYEPCNLVGLLSAVAIGPLFTFFCWGRRCAEKPAADEAEGHNQAALMLTRIQERQTAVVLERSRVAGGDASTGINACAGFRGVLPAQPTTPMAANDPDSTRKLDSFSDLPEAIPWAPAAATAPPMPPMYPVAAPVAGSQERQLSVE